MRYRLCTALIGLMFSGCIFTLPFDSLSGGVPRGGPPPTSHYPLDEPSGTIAHDITGPNEGQLQGIRDLPLWTADGKHGGALRFGVDGWIYLPTLSLAKFPPRATFVMWARPQIYFPTNENAVVAIDEDGDDDDAPIYVYITSTNVVFEAALDDTNLLTTPSVPESSWVLIAVGWDIPANTRFLYVRPDGESAFPLQSGALPSTFTLKKPQTYLLTTDGTLDDVRFYDRVLTPLELAALD